MSWISKNYEKAAVGVAVLATVGLAYAGWNKLNSVEEDFGDVPKGRGPDDPSVQDGDAVTTAKSSFQLVRLWDKAEDQGRPVDLFTGVALFVNKNSPNKPVDLIKGDPVHPPIPNSWWIENRIDPGFGDSPQRDQDEDGFSNLDEFLAGTDPNNASEYPPLITKLTYVGDETVEWLLRPGFEAGDGSFTFTYGEAKGDVRANNRVGAANPVAPGAVFFEGDPAKGRFKLLGSEKRKVMNEAIRSEVDVTFVRIEDQKPNKKGEVYEIPSSFPQRDGPKHLRHDRTAVLSLEALGLNGQEIKVEENTAFALPPGAPEKPFKVTVVTPEQVSIEFTGPDGKVETHVIAKGATGPAAP
jgi:hypothetical protein